MNIPSLAWRNTVRSLPKRWPLIVLLASTVALLLVGNTLFENTTEGLKRTYTHSLTGDWTVSAKGKEGFTIFGSELPLIGEYYVLPSLPRANELLDTLRRQPGVLGALGQVTAAGLLSLGGWTAPVPVFGVSFEDYFRLFPDLKLVQGDLKSGSGGRLLVNETEFTVITQALGRAPILGEAFTLSVFNDHSFTIRQVTLQGVYRYPATDELLSRIVLTDPDTARALNGYVYGSPVAGPSSTGTSQDQLDDLFLGAGDVEKPTSKGLSQSEVDTRLADTAARDLANMTLEGSWNFLVARGTVDSAALPDDVLVRNWRSSAGGNAMVVWLVQVMFNLGLGFVMAGAAFIVINSLALSVAERTKEIGTMRALGATKAGVALAISGEVLLVVTGAGALGVAMGLVMVGTLGWVGIPLANPYLQALFGTAVLHPVASKFSLVGHLAFSVLLGLVSLVQPVRLALKISPLQAMARGH